MRKCPTCGVSRYKVKDDECSDDATTNNSRPTKVCWYLLIISRFNRFFADQNDVKNLTCIQMVKKTGVKGGKEAMVYVELN